MRQSTATMGSHTRRRCSGRWWCWLRICMTTTATAASVESAASSSSSLRSSQQQHRRLDTIRRLYGPENGSVRKHARLLEEEIERTWTGLRGDPDHIVPYLNHPFNKTQQADHRRLQDDSLFKPIRIRFETGALDNLRSANTAAKIDFIEREILPRTAQFWSMALSVVPVSGLLRISAAELNNRLYCGDSEFTTVPSSHISTGLRNTDLILYVSGTPSSRFCSGSTLAVAVACNFDQFDRPTAGAINICLSQIELDSSGHASEAVIQDNVDVAVHEVAHVLGHSSNSYRFFWDSETGEPRTPRPFSSTTVECVDGVTRSGLVLPSENTMQFFMAADGQRFASIVTPRVKAVAQNQFNCDAVQGGQLENQPTGAESCTGDHWDERLYYPSALSGVISPTTNILTHMTLALFEDSGWYKANFTSGGMTPWGLGAGCDFVEKPCLTKGNTPGIPSWSQGYFCNDNSDRGCSAALTHKLACSVIDYQNVLPRQFPEDRFNYFVQNPTWGGPRQADYCPVYGSPFSGAQPEELDCSNPSNADTINVFSEVFGPDSQCIPSTSGEGRCHVTKCILNPLSLEINVRGKWHTCEYDFQRINVRVGGGTISQTLICPRLSSACPDLFCPFNCAGRGRCNYTAEVNGTVRPRCECFDPTDTSPGCSDSLLPNGGFLDDASGLFDNLEENFFDPLVAVFVDHPDKWTTASWAWAAGLGLLMMLLAMCICSTVWPSSKMKKKKRQRPRY